MCYICPVKSGQSVFNTRFLNLSTTYNLLIAWRIGRGWIQLSTICKPFINMKRTSLERALQQLSAESGFAFHCAPEEYMARQLGALPAAWLDPLKLLEIEGRGHGRATYGITLHLLEAGARLPPDRRQERWAALEQTALELFGSLSDRPEVVAVEELTLRPRTYAFTCHGEIALTAEARAIVWF